MNELKGKIGLTDLECYFIIFSSIDHDYFNHLLIRQGDFIQWFTIDFEEREGEEEDFLEEDSLDLLGEDLFSFNKSFTFVAIFLLSSDEALL
jgi:hypothetical protein